MHCTMHSEILTCLAPEQIKQVDKENKDETNIKYKRIWQ